MSSIGLDDGYGIEREEHLGAYDDAVHEFQQGLGMSGTAAIDPMPTYQPSRDIDEEIKITKKRKPVAKLDAERLLSDRGIPDLRRRVTKRLKLRGKGDEFEDIVGLLQLYQMWLDDLYPKAKFRDGLAMIEKIGHTKRLNVMRKAWISATRPQPQDHDHDHDHDTQNVEDDTQLQHNTQHMDEDHESHHRPAIDGNEKNSEQQDEPDEDELDLLYAQATNTISAPIIQSRPPFEEVDDDLDDLDAILDEDTTKRKSINKEDDFADDEEALIAMGM